MASEAEFWGRPFEPGPVRVDPTRAAIENVVEWTRTSRGGRQFDLLQMIDAREADENGFECESLYGLCE